MIDTNGRAAAAYTDDEATLIAAVLGGVEPFSLYVAALPGDFYENGRELIQQAQDLAVDSEKLAVLVDVFWPPVAAEDAEDVFGVDLYGVTEDYDLVEVSR